MIRSAEQRPVLLGEYMVRNSATVRAAAKHFGISKSTVHKDIRTRLPHIDRKLFREVEKLLELNKQERHIRGGLATRRKYRQQRMDTEEKIE
ncbi:MAG: sporulation transcriptional regulator SpoIIID [Ruminococcus sp.]|nr:sporulation transcriptional regulator SpoIIID [Ruminococcus sp.]